MTDGFFWDGYLHWAHDIEKHDPEFGHGEEPPCLYEPIFIRLTISELSNDRIGKIREELEEILKEIGDGGAFRAQVAERVEELMFLKDFAYELVDLLIGFEHAVVEQRQPEFFIYREVARTQQDHDKYNDIFTILDVGAPARVEREAVVVRPFLPLSFAPNVIGAVIDNDIGYLNRNLRYPDETSRIAAIWLQAREKMSLSGPLMPPRVTIGEILNGKKIDDMIMQYGRDERRAYAVANDRLHTRAAFKLPPPIAAHGAMVADLALGNRDKGSMSDVPILAVQLPPEAAYDTSGTTSESYIVQGLRWICFWARRLNPEVPVVINISYGVLAGQKDGGKFLEAQIGREIELASKHINNSGSGQTVKVVFAFGNSRNERQVADVTVAAKGFAELTWLIPADNPAPSFVEVRAVGTSSPERLTDLPKKVKVTLISPLGDKIELSGGGGSTVAGAYPPVTHPGGAVSARLYNVPRRDFGPTHVQLGYTLAAVGPTRLRSHHLPRAEAGSWVLRLTNSGHQAVRVVLQIQRGDTAPGYSGGGRQSRFEGPLVPVVEDGVQGLTVVPPLTNEGTSSAFVNVAEFETAGAGRDVFGTVVPASYSAQGADWTYSIDPDHLPPVDHAFTRGVPVSGAYSGTRARLSGTSAGAALTTREMIEGP